MYPENHNFLLCLCFPTFLICNKEVNSTCYVIKLVCRFNHTCVINVSAAVIILSESAKFQIKII